MDYEGTFSSVVSFESVHSIITLAAHGSTKLYQMDVKTAFLNGELYEEGFVEKAKKTLCQLKKCIYID